MRSTFHPRRTAPLPPVASPLVLRRPAPAPTTVGLAPTVTRLAPPLSHSAPSPRPNTPGADRVRSGFAVDSFQSADEPHPPPPAPPAPSLPDPASSPTGATLQSHRYSAGTCGNTHRSGCTLKKAHTE